MPSPEAFLPYTEKANSHLAYFKPEKVEWLTALAVENWNNGYDLFYWRRDQEQLTPGEKRELGHGKWEHIPRSLFDAMTSTGRLAILPRFEVTLMRARILYHWHREREELRHFSHGSMPLFPFAQFRADPEWPCQAAVALQGDVLDAGSVLELPLTGCKAEYCRCDFRSLRRK